MSPQLGAEPSATSLLTPRAYWHVVRKWCLLLTTGAGLVVQKWCLAQDMGELAVSGMERVRAAKLDTDCLPSSS